MNVTVGQVTKLIDRLSSPSVKARWRAALATGQADQSWLASAHHSLLAVVGSEDDPIDLTRRD